MEILKLHQPKKHLEVNKSKRKRKHHLQDYIAKTFHVTATEHSKNHAFVDVHMYQGLTEVFSIIMGGLLKLLPKPVVHKVQLKSYISGNCILIKQPKFYMSLDPSSFRPPVSSMPHCVIEAATLVQTFSSAQIPSTVTSVPQW